MSKEIMRLQRELADIKFGSDQSKCIEREKKLNAYIEYIAHTIVNLPMPD